MGDQCFGHISLGAIEVDRDHPIEHPELLNPSWHQCQGPIVGRHRFKVALPGLIFDLAARRAGAHHQSHGREQSEKRPRSEEHTSELQSLMRISYAVFCLKKKKTKKNTNHTRKIHTQTESK